MKLVFLIFASVFVIGCAQERPMRRLIDDGKRLDKSLFKGEFFYLKTLVELRSPSPKYDYLAPGFYLDRNRTIQFVAKENYLEVVSTTATLRADAPEEESRFLARFPIRHVDVLPELNAEGKETHREEETKSRRRWQDRKFIKIDPARDVLDPLGDKETRSSVPPDKISVDASRGAFNFDVEKQLVDGTWMKIHYSFLRASERSYQPRDYTLNLLTDYGFFSTVSQGFDATGRATLSSRREWINRWDLSSPILLYFTKEFPERLMAQAHRAVADWNRVFQEEVGTSPLVLEKNSGQEWGDLRFNLLGYLPGENAARGPIAYAPSTVDPSNGRIVKADVLFYGGRIRGAIHHERALRRLVARERPPVTESTDTQRPPSEAPDSNANPPIDVVIHYRPEAALTRWHREMDLHQQGFRTDLNEGFAILENPALVDESDETIEASLFAHSLPHELGHFFGFAHNHMAAADKKNWQPGSQGSSVLFYPKLSEHRPDKPGPYDRALVAVSYGNNPQRMQAYHAKRFLYCGDAHLLSSKAGLCQTFSTGSNLKEISDSLVDRYETSFVFNNLSQDDVYFGKDDAAYIDRVSRHLLALRLLHDHAMALSEFENHPSVVELLRFVRRKESPSTEVREQALQPLGRLWELARQQIEATSETPSYLQLSVPIVVGMNARVDPNVGSAYRTEIRTLDLSKIEPLLKDARAAKSAALSALEHVTLETKRRSDDFEDPVRGLIYARSVVWDRMLALRFLASLSPHPLYPQTRISPYHANSDEARVFVDLLSNTRTTDTRIKIVEYDPALRMLALHLLLNELGSPSSPSARLRKLISMEKRNLRTERKALDDIEVFRKTIREKMEPLVDLPDNGSNANKVWADISRIEARCTQLNPSAYFTLTPDHLLKTPEGAKATRRLFRENINRTEDRIQAIEAAIGKEKSDEKRTPLRALQHQLEAYLERERAFVEKIYRAVRLD